MNQLVKGNRALWQRHQRRHAGKGVNPVGATGATSRRRGHWGRTAARGWGSCTRRRGGTTSRVATATMSGLLASVAALLAVVAASPHTAKQPFAVVTVFSGATGLSRTTGLNWSTATCRNMARMTTKAERLGFGARQSVAHNSYQTCESELNRLHHNLLSIRNPNLHSLTMTMPVTYLPGYIPASSG